jgi:autotransporter-associated beta strand protein
MRRYLILVALAGALAACPLAASADVYVERIAIADSYVEDAGTTASRGANHGTESKLLINSNGSNRFRLSYFKFSVADLDGGLTLDALIGANLTMTRADLESTINNMTFGIYGLVDATPADSGTSGWTETGITWSNAPARYGAYGFTTDSGTSTGTPAGYATLLGTMQWNGVATSNGSFTFGTDSGTNVIVSNDFGQNLLDFIAADTTGVVTFMMKTNVNNAKVANIYSIDCGISDYFPTLSLAFTPPGVNGWENAAGGDWSASANWTIGVPNSVGSQAVFGSKLEAPGTVNLDVAPTVGTIKFDNANKYTIGGTYTLTLATSSGNASIQVDTGSHEIAAPVTLGSDLAANIAGDLLTISGPMDGPYGVTKTGAGKLEINGTATYTGTTHVVNGELALGAAQTLGAVVIDSSALVTLVDGATQISSLEIAGGSSAPEAKLDIMSNALIIDYSGGSSPLADIEAMVIKGYNGGDWAGNGITSSVLFDITAEAIGVVDNTTFLGGGLGEFAGRSIGMETVLVKKVIAGDIDMSGEVNAADYFYIDFNLDTAGGGWGAGDLDYSGETNSADYFYIDFNLGMSEGASMGTSIPEPATLVLLTLGGLAVVRRRR